LFESQNNFGSTEIEDLKLSEVPALEKAESIDTANFRLAIAEKSSNDLRFLTINRESRGNLDSKNQLIIKAKDPQRPNEIEKDFSSRDSIAEYGMLYFNMKEAILKEVLEEEIAVIRAIQTNVRVLYSHLQQR